MKHKHFRTLAWIFTLCTLIPVAASCGDTADSGGTAAVDTKETAVHTDAQTEAGAQPFSEPDDYGGAEVFMQHFQVYWAPALYAAEETGDAYNDVLYKRIRAVEDYLNIDITYDDSIGIDDTARVVQTNVAAGDDAIQLVLSHDMTGNSPLVTQNLCTDMTSVESIDLTRDYWKFSTYDALTVNGHVYIAKPAFIIPSVGCFTFNKAMMAEYDIPEPYEEVRNGTWTIDRLMELCKIVTKDSNGDGTMDEKDTYGMVSGGDWYLNAFVWSLGSTVTALDDTGKIVLSLDTPHTVEVFGKLHEFLNLSGDTRLLGDISMKDGRALFAHTTTNGLSSLRDSEVEYGVLPYPKWDAAQETYRGYDISAFVSIPSSVSDAEMVGKTLEMLNFYGEELVLPTYYDIHLNTKSVRDEASVEMLDLIFNSIYCDAGRTYFGREHASMTNLVYSISLYVCPRSTADFASFYAKNQKSAQKCIDQFYEAVDALD